MWSSAEAGVASPAGILEDSGMWCLLPANCSKPRREVWPGGSSGGGVPALWKHRGGFEIPDIYVRSTHVLGVWCLNLLSGLDFRLAFPSWASRNNLSPSHLGVNLQFPIGSGAAWVVGFKKKKKELYPICFTRSFCPLDTFSSFWPDKAYLSSGYEPIIQSWIEIYGHSFLPAHTRRLRDSRNCLCTGIKKTQKTKGKKKTLMHFRSNNLLAVLII